MCILLCLCDHSAVVTGWVGRRSTTGNYWLCGVCACAHVCARTCVYVYMRVGVRNSWRDSTVHKRFVVAGLKRSVVADTGYRTVLVDCGFTNSTDVEFSAVNGA